jgi:GR25 family glycosyltransferase involved in LPS biosynthesis
MPCSPILLLIFNRPEKTQLVFDAIKKQRPERLFIAADGHRENRIGEKKLCEATRRIIEQVDWSCELKTLFREKNIGSKYAVSSAINWFFEDNEYGIILEDDCIPNDSFFTFCSQLLMRYEHDQSIMHITGTNLNDTVKYGDGSYFFSHYPNVWGWATWKRAWDKFDLELADDQCYLSVINSTFRYYSERRFWKSRLDLVRSHHLDAWDYQWMFSIWREKGLCVNSNYNLVENIGFGNDSTHTAGKSPYISPQKKNLENINTPSDRTIIKKAEINFIQSLHGIKRITYFEYIIRKHFLQRFTNLFHKLKLLGNT